MDENVLSYIATAAGLAVVAVLSVRGTADASTVIITSTTMHARKRGVLVASYITSSFSTTIFLLGFIVSCIVITGLEREMTLARGVSNFVACFVYGLASHFSGDAMGVVCRTSFPVLAVERRFFLLFFLTVTVVEIILVFSFVISMLVRQI